MKPKAWFYPPQGSNTFNVSEIGAVEWGGPRLEVERLALKTLDCPIIRADEVRASALRATRFTLDRAYHG